MSSRTPYLTLRGIRKRFGRLEVLQGIDLDLLAGEVLVLAGTNGAGKSTFTGAIIVGAVLFQRSRRNG